MSGNQRISSIELDEKSLAPAGPDAEHERKIAIFDLIEDNRFAVVDHVGGPYALVLSLADNRLVFDVSESNGQHVRRFILSLTALRRVIKDYFMVCESYYEAIRNATTAHIEAIDMGRRGLHNEGSELLTQRLSDKVDVDFDTARRLFTLVCALHSRG
ncbi:MAG: UPF0262 family protein [Alphaproteobacteria bacterium]|nr:UPF0262 family protein [Alphaproteobacteria bacterium]